MGLSFGGSTSFMKNAFADTILVSDVKDVSGITNNFGNTPDLAIEIEFPGQNGTPFHQTLGGNFKRENDTIVSWGGAFVLQNLIQTSAFFKTMSQRDKDDFLALIEVGKVPGNFIKFLKGKTLHKISYVKGFKEDNPSKLAYASFNQLGWDKDQLISAFQKGLAKGYPKNYNPDAVAGPVDTQVEGDTEFNHGANVQDANDDVI